MIRINQLKLLVDHTEAQLSKRIAHKLKLKKQQNFTYQIIRRSLDARHKPELKYTYTVDVNLFDELVNDELYISEQKLVSKLADPQILVHQPISYRFPVSRLPNADKTGADGTGSDRPGADRTGSDGPGADGTGSDRPGADRIGYEGAGAGPANAGGSTEKADFQRPIIVGMGPAGLFCGYMLALNGFRPLILERGEAVEERSQTVARFWQDGVLNPESNVQFGEGGAGTFSDGKLNTLNKDREGRNRAVLSILVEAGAPKQILYEHKPHIGTDILTGVVRQMRKTIITAGGEVRFGQKVTGILTDRDQIIGVEINGSEQMAARQVVLAIGHSARDTFQVLYDAGVPMEAKAFAVGLRVEHPQALINRSQYGTAAHDILAAADYKVVARGTVKPVYSFCMCPGGFVVNASSEEGRTVVNGMSYGDRKGSNANSAIVTTVAPKDYGGSHPLAGVAFQRRLEEKAFTVGNGKIPVEYYRDFKAKGLGKSKTAGVLLPEEQSAGVSLPAEQSAGVPSPAEQSERVPSPEGQSAEVSSLKEQSAEVPSPERQLIEGQPEGGRTTEARPPGVAGEFAAGSFGPMNKGAWCLAPVHEILPPELNRVIIEAMTEFGRMIKGFDDDMVAVSGVESRTSSPVRIIRDDRFQSAISGLYPCGEGAGYAGGIMSAAVDGIKIAEAVAAGVNLSGNMSAKVTIQCPFE